MWLPPLCPPRSGLRLCRGGPHTYTCGPEAIYARAERQQEHRAVISRGLSTAPHTALTSWEDSLGLNILLWKMDVTSVSWMPLCGCRAGVRPEQARGHCGRSKAGFFSKCGPGPVASVPPGKLLEVQVGGLTPGVGPWWRALLWCWCRPGWGPLPSASFHTSHGGGVAEVVAGVGISFEGRVSPSQRGRRIQARTLLCKGRSLLPASPSRPLSLTGIVSHGAATTEADSTRLCTPRAGAGLSD